MRVSAHNDTVMVLSAFVSGQICTFYLIFCASFVSYIHKSLLKSPKMLNAWQVPLLVFLD